LNDILQELGNSILKYIWKLKRPQIAKVILSKTSNAGDIIVPDFKLYYRAITIKTAWYKNRQEGQRIRIEDLDINALIYSHPIFDKGAQIHDGEKKPSSTDIAGRSGYPHIEN
jgi:uncharacterized protein (DUF736 family)